MSTALDLRLVADYNEVKHVQYTHRSLANLLFVNALVTAAAGLDCFCTKVGVARVQKWA